MLYISKPYLRRGRMGCCRCGRGNPLTWSGGGGPMNTPSLDSAIVTLVTFAPLAGALLLVLVPRRDRDIRIFLS